ncbi:hypothetical protein [Halorubrum trueperi]|uniref:Uncharacterized protein n=1 Tax=Halorubrum trueperi TaxID=2004704 RepID=A0ABD5UFE6_9EURY
MQYTPRLGGRIAVGLVVLVTLLAVEAAALSATPPPANESRTLDARDPDACLSPAEYNATYDHPPTPTQELATCTDLTYDAPPAHAANWTAEAFPALSPGEANTSVHPPHAELTSDGAVADAHVTLFGVHPATEVHVDDLTTRQYIAPNGTVRALVDYRVRDAVMQNRSVLSHEVKAVRLRIGDEDVATTSGSQTPVLSYATTEPGAQSLTITAEIAVTTATNGSRTDTTTQTVTVSDTRSVWVQTLAPDAYTAAYPDNTTGVAVYQAQPWHGLTLSADETRRVRGGWRYYTARDTRWDTLQHSRATGGAEHATPAPPMDVVAFPARIGPRALPVRDGPALTAVWGVSTPSPTPQLHPNVSVGVVTGEYTRSYGLAVRTDRFDPESVRLHGIVRGVSAPLASVTRSERPIRRPNLTVRVTETTASTATLRISLRDAATGTPIQPNRSAPVTPIVDGGPPGTLSLNGEPISLGANGTTTRTVREPGLYTVRFEPASWRTTTPAYVGASDTVRWHPLGTMAGWLQLVTTLLWGAFPIAVAWVAGRRLSHLLSGTSRP